MIRSLSSCLDATRMWRRTERASLEKRSPRRGVRRRRRSRDFVNSRSDGDPDSAWTPGRVDPARADRALTFIFMLTCEVACTRDRAASGRCDGLYADLIVVGVAWSGSSRAACEKSCMAIYDAIRQPRDRRSRCSRSHCDLCRSRILHTAWQLAAAVAPRAMSERLYVRCPHRAEVAVHRRSGGQVASQALRLGSDVGFYRA